MFNPFNWGRKPRDEAAEAAKAAADAEAAARAETVARHAEADAAAAALQRQLRTLGLRVEDTLKKLELAERRRDEHMAAVAAAAAAGSEARKKLHWRNKKRADDEIASLSSHLTQLEDMRATCEKRITQLERQQDLELATAALEKAKVDVNEVEAVMEAAKDGVENVNDIELVMNSYQLEDDVLDDDEMAAELAKFTANANALKPEEVSKMTEPQVPSVTPAEAKPAKDPSAVVAEADLKRLENEMAK